MTSKTPATPAPKKTTTAAKKATKATAAPTPTPVIEPVPVESAETAAVVESAVVEESTLMDEWAQYEKDFAEHLAKGAALKKKLSMLVKKTVREMKAAKKASTKRKAKSGNRSPSGFIKPTLVSDELATFLGKVKGTEMARTDVTREINLYIRANNLQDKDNGRKIIPDAALAKLLKLNKSDELTYFNLQKYMSPHFPKSAKAIAAAAAAAASS